MPEMQSSDPDWTLRITISKKYFGAVEELQRRVVEKKQRLDDATAAKKLAQGDHDAARDAFERAVARLIDEAHGRPELPLFANMSDAIASATNDPIVDGLLKRLIDHAIDHLNILIVAGWTEEERAQVIAYLDSVDARTAAEEQAAAIPPGSDPVTIPDALEMPAFLVRQPDEVEGTPPVPGPTDQEITEALTWCDVALTAAQISWMTYDQRLAVMTWAYRVKHIKAAKGEALTLDDLPPAPSFVLNPDELAADEQLGKHDVKKPTPPKKKGGKGRKKKGQR